MRRWVNGVDEEISNHFITNDFESVMLSTTLQNLGINRVLVNSQIINITPNELLELVVGFLEGAYNPTFISNTNDEYYLIEQHQNISTLSLPEPLINQDLNLSNRSWDDQEFITGRHVNIFRDLNILSDEDTAELYFDRRTGQYIFDDDPNRVVHIETPRGEELEQLIRGITQEIIDSMPPDYRSPSPPPRYRSPQKLPPTKRSKPVSPPRKRKVAPKRATTRRKPEKPKDKRKLSKSPPLGKRRR